MTKEDAKALIRKKRDQLAGLRHLREPRGTTCRDMRLRLEAEIVALEDFIATGKSA